MTQLFRGVLQGRGTNANSQTPVPQLCFPENRAADELEDESQWTR